MMNENLQTGCFDILIVGGGPAGSSAAITLAQYGYEIAVVDKATFPRDKICGDAISLDVINQLSKLHPKLGLNFIANSKTLDSYAVSIAAPNHNVLTIPFYKNGKQEPGYLCKRYDFDNLLFQFAKSYKNVKTFEASPVENIHRSGDKIRIQLKDCYLTGKQIVGADGIRSVVNKCLGELKPDKQFSSAGLRIYYDNVGGFNNENNVELHFFKNTIPGYMWIFPMANNKANVGIGILSSTVSQKKLNLKQVLNDLINNKPHLKERFKDAVPLETPKGFGLPLGGKKRPVSGDNFLLTGDAAGFIDPFTGEGIGNAVRSGRFAAQHLNNSLKAGDYSARFNKNYDKIYYDKMWREFRISRTIQLLSQNPQLFNFIINTANKSPILQWLIKKAAHL